MAKMHNWQLVRFVRDNDGEVTREAEVIQAQTRQSAEGKVKRQYGPKEASDGSVNWTLGAMVGEHQGAL